jgi:multiple sugar transport system substrate-binding protein
MEELELSIMARGRDPAGDLQPFLDQFAALYRCRVRVKVLPWETAWADLVKVALYSSGPDVSEVGMNWVGNLVAMDSLRPFHAGELDAIGGSSAFLESAWKSGWMIGDKRLWAVPWLADTRVIYYRRDLLERAGVDESTAFQSPQQLGQTLECLRASGVALPWVVPTSHALNTLHNVASWVWGAGGDFVSADGKRALFNQAEAHAGIRAYLGLHRYLTSVAHRLNIGQSDALYDQGQAAVTISGPWLALFYLESSSTSGILVNTRAALPPGVPFLGGSNLVIWKHSQHEHTAVELVRFLVSQSVQRTYFRRAGLLPVRLDALGTSPFVDDLLYRVMSEASKIGRSFPSFSAWGLIEDGITAELDQLWADVLADPQLDLDAAINERLGTLARQLDYTLSQTV